MKHMSSYTKLSTLSCLLLTSLLQTMEQKTIGKWLKRRRKETSRQEESKLRNVRKPVTKKRRLRAISKKRREKKETEKLLLTFALIAELPPEIQDIIAHHIVKNVTIETAARLFTKVQGLPRRVIRHYAMVRLERYLRPQTPWKIQPSFEKIDTTPLSTKKLSVSPNNQWIASIVAYNSKHIYLHNKDKPYSSIIIKGRQENITAICFSPDNIYLVIACNDKKVKFWHLEEQEFKFELIQNVSPCHMAFSPDGTFLMVATVAGSIYVWKKQEDQTWKSIQKLMQHFSQIIYALEFAPDQSYFATIANDRKLIIWHHENGQWSQKISKRFLYLQHSLLISADSNILVTRQAPGNYSTMYNRKTGFKSICCPRKQFISILSDSEGSFGLILSKPTLDSNILTIVKILSNRIETLQTFCLPSGVRYATVHENNLHFSQSRMFLSSPIHLYLTKQDTLKQLILKCAIEQHTHTNNYRKLETILRTSKTSILQETNRDLVKKYLLSHIKKIKHRTSENIISNLLLPNIHNKNFLKTLFEQPEIKNLDTSMRHYVEQKIIQEANKQIRQQLRLAQTFNQAIKIINSPILVLYDGIEREQARKKICADALKKFSTFQ